VERIIRLETELFKAQKISSAVLAATLVMSNKLIDKNAGRFGSRPGKGH
jgi:hypothetical protein